MVAAQGIKEHVNLRNYIRQSPKKENMIYIITQLMSNGSLPYYHLCNKSNNDPRRRGKHTCQNNIITGQYMIRFMNSKERHLDAFLQHKTYLY
jgi:hypothetical protein